MAADRNITFHTAHDMTAVDSDSERWVLLTSNVVFMLLALPDGSGAFHPPRRSCVHLVQPGPSQSPGSVRPLVLALSSSGLVWTRFLCTLTGQWQNSLIDVAASSHTRTDPSSMKSRRLYHVFTTLHEYADIHSLTL